jgi:hypothetical protein
LWEGETTTSASFQSLGKVNGNKMSVLTFISLLTRFILYKLIVLIVEIRENRKTNFHQCPRTE